MVVAAAQGLHAKTPLTGLRREPAVPRRVCGRFAPSTNNRNPQYHDVHQLDLATGQLTLVRQNDEYAGFMADWDHNLVFAQKQIPGGGFAIDRLGKDGKARLFGTIPADDNLTTGLLGTIADGSTVYMRDSRNRNTGALIAIDLASEKTTLLGGSEKADVVGTLRDPVTGVIEACSVNYLKNEWTPLGSALQDDIAFLNREARGKWSVTSRSRDKRLWTAKAFSRNA